MASYETIERTMLEALAENESMRGLNIDEQKRLFFKMRVFQLGLSAMVANSHVPSWLDDQEVEKLLLEVGMVRSRRLCAQPSQNRAYAILTHTALHKIVYVTLPVRFLMS